MKTGRPPLFTSADEMQKVIDEYFESVSLTHDNVTVSRPTMAGLALSLDMDRKSLLNYSKKEEFFPTIKRAKQRVEAELEKALYGTGVAGVIFNLKNNFDWRDKQEVEQSGVTVVKIMGEF